MIHIVTSLRTKEGFHQSNKGKSAWTKFLGEVLKLRTNEKLTRTAGTKELVYSFHKKGL